MIIVTIIEGYITIGILFAIFFVFFKIKKVDDSSIHAPIFFKVLIFPGLALMWPFIIGKNKIEHL
jgi:hypothetical protein